LDFDTILLPFPFKLNGMFCPKQHRFIHCSKKKAPNDAILNSIVGLLLPVDTRGRGRRFFSPVFLLPLSFLKLKKTPTKAPPPRPPTCLSFDPWPTTVWKTEGLCPSGGLWGGCMVAAPATLPLFLPINTREERAQERGMV